MGRFHHILFALAVLLIFPGPGGEAKAMADGEPEGLSWLDGFSLVVLETEDVHSMRKALSVIHSSGGRIAIMSPPSIMMGWISPDVREDLIGRAGIEDIYYTEVMPGEVRVKDEQTRRMIRYFNAVARGEIQERYKMRKELAARRGEKPVYRPDALDPPAFDEEGYLDNLRDVGLDVRSLRQRGLLLQKSGEIATGNSDRMTGTVAVTVFFVESDGSGSDPDLYTWTDQHMQDYINGVNDGLAWWSSQAYNYSDCWVAFMVRYYAATDPRCQQWYEPVLHPSSYQADWVSLVMANFGYTSGGAIARVNAFNTWQRSTYGTDWAYSAFVAYNPPGASDRFTDGYAAAAYWGGPYTYLLYRSFGWQVNEVFTHESGHIFYACDEYYQAGYGGCTSCATCSNGVDNGNCAYCGPGKSCMMNDNAFRLCQYTPGHVGWFSSPCAPPPLTPPTAVSSYPSEQYQGLDEVLTVVGSDFLYGAFVDLGPDIVVNSMSYVSPETIMADITVVNTATPGLRDVIVYNRDLQSDTLFGAFRVLRTTRHYMSPTGGDVFPYISPEKAATSLTEAIAAAGDGDSLFVATTTLSIASPVIDRAVELYGGWSSDFSARDLESGKTVLSLSGDLAINPGGGGEAVLDGFVLENGEGAYQTVPFQGYFGGGVRILGGEAAVTNCEIRSNTAGDGGSNVGIGGGIFAMNSDVRIENNYIWGNSAEKGGGVYLFQCTGSITGNTIASNQVASGSSVEARGAGIYLASSDSVLFAGNNVTANSGAYMGGGLFMDQCSGVLLSGGEISHNGASWGGGGIEAIRSDLILDSVTFERNSSSVLGGAAALEESTSASITACRFLWNTAPVGGAIYAGGGACFVNHNLFIGNAGSTAGAMYLATLSDGSIMGNTIDRSDAGGAGGAVFVNSSEIPLFDNIVTNTTGYGIVCAGTPIPNPRYNDVWNSSAGDYSGCAPGEGSVSADPLYADTSAVDYHLAVHSPAIDRGDTATIYSDPDGSRGDMGMYGSHLFSMDRPSYPKNLTLDLVSWNAVLSWDRNPEGDVQHYAVYRDTIAGFVPDAANFVRFVPATDTTFTEAFIAGSYYKISAVDSAGYASGYSNEVNPTATAVAGGVVRYKFHLYPNIPNPFNPITTIRYEIERKTPVTLTIYDVQGRVVRRLIDRTEDPGIYIAMWNGRNDRGQPVSSGIYFCKLRAGDKTMTRKMVLLK